MDRVATFLWTGHQIKSQHSAILNVCQRLSDAAGMSMQLNDEIWERAGKGCLAPHTATKLHAQACCGSLDLVFSLTEPDLQEQ